MTLQRYALDKMAPGMFKHHHGQYVKHADALAAIAAAVAAERERWQRISSAAQALTEGALDMGESFRVPSHLMSALALALDDGPNVAHSVYG